MISNHSGSIRIFFGFLFFIILTGCTRKSENTTSAILPDDVINYKEHIEPIITSKCLDCHGSPPTDGAPVGSQYTSFNDVIKWNEDILGQVLDKEMPPPEENNPLTLQEILLLRTWIDEGFVFSKNDTTKGLQQFTGEFKSLNLPLRSVEDTVTLSFDFQGQSATDSMLIYMDTDVDGLNGTLISEKIGIDSFVNYQWEVKSLPSVEKYYIYAIILHEDGAADTIQSSSYLYIPLRNAAPTVSILKPSLDKASEDSLLKIIWQQGDVDSDRLRTSLYYKTDSTDTFKSFFENQTLITTEFEWDVSSFFTGSGYKLKIVVEDDKDAKTELIHGPFSIINGSLPTYIGNIKTIIDFHCNNCHGVPPYDDPDAPDSFNLLTYDSVVVWAERIKVRTIEEKNMPPEEEDPLTNAENEQLLLWIQSGMVEGEANLPPIFDLVNPTMLDTAFLDRYLITWLAEDLDNDANITLYWMRDSNSTDTNLIIDNLKENTDKNWTLNTEKFLSGDSFYILGKIFDGVNDPIWSLSKGKIVIQNRNAAPSVSFISPVPFDAMLDSTFNITWMEIDPDDDSLKVSLYYRIDSISTKQLIIDKQYITTKTFTWNISTLSSGTQYALFITVEDATGAQAQDSVKDITIVNGSVPTYIGTIKPIIELKCNGCHGIPPDTSAPDTFNLVTYDTVVALANEIRVEVFEDKDMPPSDADEQLTDLEKEQLLLWLQSGMPKGSINLAPTFSILTPAGRSDTAKNDSYRITWSASDLDNEAFISIYYYLDSSPQDTVIIAERLKEGIDSVYDINTSQLNSGSVLNVFGYIFDGVNDTLWIQAPGKIVVENRNAAPTVALVTPTRLAAIIDSQYTITWSATDPENDPLKISLFYRIDSISPWVVIIENQIIASQNYLWNVSSFSSGTSYALYIKVEDPQGAADLDTVTEVTIVNGNVPTYIGSIKSIIELKCNDCHAIPPKEKAPDTFNLVAYDSVVAVANEILREVFADKKMPPEDVEQLTQEEKDLLLLWLQSGMPEGSVNISPTFSFTNPSILDTAKNDMYTIRWNAEDLDNNAEISLFYFRESVPQDTVLIVANLKENDDSSYQINTSQMSSGTQLNVFAFIYDGVNDTLWVTATGKIVVETRNAAPTVTITSPKPFDAVLDSTFTITWTESDPESQPLKISVYYKIDSINSLVPIVENTIIPSKQVSWDVSTLTSGGKYNIHILAEDPLGLQDRDSVFNITVVNGNIPTYWGTIKPIIEIKCNNCHGIVPDTSAPDSFNLASYDSVVAWGERIRIRTIEERTMPPVDETDLTSQERDDLLLWLQSGMPEGQGNLPPTIELTSPAADTALTQDQFTITWTASDLDNNAMVSLYWYNTVTLVDTILIVENLSEDTDNSYLFNTASVPGNTTIRILGKIFDGVNPIVLSESFGRITTANRNTTPTVVMAYPNSGDILNNNPAQINWIANDPDGDNIKFEIGYSVDSVNFTFVDTVVNDTFYNWDVTNIPFGTKYFLRIIAVDQPNQASDTVISERFGVSISPQTFPTYYASILPIFNDKCNSCHKSPYDNNAPTTFDLSMYNQQGPTAGAYEKRSQTKSQVFLDLMPPISADSLTSYEKEQILQWVLGGALEGQQGTSVTPTFTFKKPIIVDDTVINDLYTIEWSATDPDNDADISIYYDTDNINFDGTLIDSTLRENIDSSLSWNTSTILSGITYYLYSKIYDGVNDTVKTYSLGYVFVPSRSNSPPTANITAPLGGEMFTSFPISIQWAASDIDGDNLNIQIFYDTSDGNWQSIYNGSNTGNFNWTPTGLSNSFNYRIKIVATDPLSLTAEDITLAFTIHNGTTAYYYNDGVINSFFNTYCTSCHAGNGSPKRLFLDTYRNITQKPTNIDKIRERTNVLKDMPPASESIQPTQEERNRILDWILGGNPEN